MEVKEDLGHEPPVNLRLAWAGTDSYVTQGSSGSHYAFTREASVQVLSEDVRELLGRTVGYQTCCGGPVSSDPIFILELAN